MTPAFQSPPNGSYESLRNKGYDVKTNPHRIDPGTGERISASELKGVYEVAPRKAMARDAAPANLSERRAQQGAPADAAQARAT